jgi:hypothetical protein
MPTSTGNASALAQCTYFAVSRKEGKDRSQYLIGPALSAKPFKSSHIMFRALTKVANLKFGVLEVTHSEFRLDLTDSQGLLFPALPPPHPHSDHTLIRLRVFFWGAGDILEEG